MKNNWNAPRTAEKVDLIKYTYDDKGEPIEAMCLPLCGSCKHADYNYGGSLPYCKFYHMCVHPTLTCLHAEHREEVQKNG